MLDQNTEFGAHAARRFNAEQIIWLVTVTPNGVPQPSPVWFVWDGNTFLLFSQPGKPKLRNIEHNPNVALSPMLDKYRETIASMGTTPEALAQDFSVPFRVTPDRIWGH